MKSQKRFKFKCNVDQSNKMLTVAIANESAARVHHMMFAASRRKVITIVARFDRWRFIDSYN